MQRPNHPPRNRESRIVLDGQGRFWHDGERVRHAGLHRAFARWLDRHPTDGRFVLKNREDWCYVTVEDTPFFVTRLHLDGEVPELSLFDESREPLRPDALWVDDAGVLRTLVKNGRFEARFLRAAQLQVAPLLDADEPWVLWLGGRRYSLRRA